MKKLFCLVSLLTLFSVEINSSFAQTNMPVRAITPWEAFSAAVSWSENASTFGFKRRVGDSLEVRITVKLSGSPETENFTIFLPDELEIDLEKVGNPPSNSFHAVGHALLHNRDGAAIFGQVLPSGKDRLRIRAASSTSPSASTYVNSTQPFRWSADDEMSILFTVPVQRWQL